MDNLSLEKQPIRILFLGSDPTDQGKVRLGKELEVIRAELSKNTSFEIKDRQAVKPKDALTTIMNYKPNIVHFSGHGMESGDICFEDEKGLTKAVPPDVLADLFKLTTDYVKCIVLNTCFSEKQVKAISPYVPMVIGTKHEISDTAAINFSAGFYTALEPDLSQKSLVRAFESGRINIKLENVPEHLAPVMVEGTPEVRFSSEVDSAFRSITKTKGVVFDVLRKGLELTGKKMGLDNDVVTHILSDKVSQLEKHLDALMEYETALKGFLEDEYPLSEAATTALSYLQNGLELTNADIQSINERNIVDTKLSSAENWYDRGRKQASQNNDEKAVLYYTKAIEIDPRYSGAYYERGYCYDKLNAFKLAIEDFTKAIQLDSKWDLATISLAYYSRARCYHALRSDDKQERSNNLNMSLADWNKTIELDPGQSEAYYGRGLVFEELSKQDEAIADYSKAYEMSPSAERKKTMIFALVRTLHKIGKSEEATKWMNKVSEEESKSKRSDLAVALN